jgi:hypothetical protein
VQIDPEVREKDFSGIQGLLPHFFRAWKKRHLQGRQTLKRNKMTSPSRTT